MTARVSRATLAVMIGVLAGSGPALAVDPFVYRQCLAQCKRFEARSCCHEQCSYNACIAEKVRTSIGHGSRKESTRLEQNDPGAWSGAMAACYPWISILQECSAGNPGRSATQAPVDGTALPTTPEHRSAPSGKVVLRRVGEPIVDPTDANWVTVQSGTIINQGYGYKGTYTWSEPPVEIGVRGFPLELKVTSHSEGGQRMATGISVYGDFDFVSSAGSKTPGTTSYPANSDSSVNKNDTKDNGGTIYVVPRRYYAAGSQVTLKVGAFWGSSVRYVYAPVAP